MANRSAVSGAGASKAISSVKSSTAVNLASVPLPERASSGVVFDAVLSGLLIMSFHQYMTSAVVNGLPSDHLMPSRMWNVHLLVSSLCSQLSAQPGPISRPSLSQRSGEWPYWLSSMMCWTPHSQFAVVWMTPPYLPVVSQGCGGTYGFLGRR